MLKKHSLNQKLGASSSVFFISLTLFIALGLWFLHDGRVTAQAQQERHVQQSLQQALMREALLVQQAWLVSRPDSFPLSLLYQQQPALVSVTPPLTPVGRMDAWLDLQSIQLRWLDHGQQLQLQHSQLGWQMTLQWQPWLAQSLPHLQLQPSTHTQAMSWTQWLQSVTVMAAPSWGAEWVVAVVSVFLATLLARLAYYRRAFVRLRRRAQHRQHNLQRQLQDSQSKHSRWEHLALHDSLTGLPNRAYLQQCMTESLCNLADERWLAVLFLDLDGFKQVNDRYGHAIGDDLLCALAARLRGSLRSVDCIARFGGDEFVVCVSGLATPQAAIAVAEKVISIMQQPVALETCQVGISTCVGISMTTSRQSACSLLVEQADEALYQAKQQGQGEYHIYQANQLATPWCEQTEACRLEAALEAGELVLYLQPRYALLGGHMLGVEALVRWQHPEHGLLTPEHFMPLAESSGLSLSIADWVLESVAAQVQRWTEAGLPALRVAINMSRQQLLQPDFARQWVERCWQCGVPPDMLDLEFNEQDLNACPHIEQLLAELYQQGFGLVLDEFGTGLASVALIRQTKLTGLKVDRMILATMLEQPQQSNLVRGIVALSKQLQLNVCAEGVETQAQVDFLTQLQCDQVQGRFYQDALAVDEFFRLRTQLLSGVPLSRSMAS